LRSSNLLEIKLPDINSVPQVFYKGQEITKKVRVSFDWETNGPEIPIHPDINIEHVEKGSNDLPYIKAIRYKSLFKEDE
jgi:hypothetical protein